MSSANYGKRPQSAQQLADDREDTHIRREKQERAIHAAILPLQVSSNKKATKCLKQANWIKQWYKKAYITIDTHGKLEQALSAASAPEKNLDLARN